MKNICVYGAASALIHPDYLSEAKKLGVPVPLTERMYEKLRRQPGL